MSKGSNRRPQETPTKQVNKHYSKTFKGNNNTIKTTILESASAGSIKLIVRSVKAAGYYYSEKYIRDTALKMVDNNELTLFSSFSPKEEDI